MPSDASAVTGGVEITLYGPDGTVKWHQVVCNLITDAGDLYYSTRAIAGVSPANAAQPTLAGGMKLGTGATAAAKNGAGAALVTYLSGTNVAFDATFPAVNNLGAGLGVEGRYQVTFGAGVGTGTVSEAVIVTDAGTNATSTAANTVSRVVFGPVTKGSSDVLVILWKHKFLGS